MKSYIVRIATIDDSTQIASLLKALGHDTSNERVTAMWHDWAVAGNRAYVAATPMGELVGVVTVHEMAVLHRPMPVGRITALYVSDGCRNQGVGRALVDAAETVLRNRGCGLLEITSNFRLNDAHAFYEHLGYTKTSVRLAKDLVDGALETRTQGVTNNAVNRSGEVGHNCKG